MSGIVAAETRFKRRPHVRVAARIQRTMLSAVMTLLVALVDRRLRKALNRNRPV